MHSCKALSITHTHIEIEHCWSQASVFLVSVLSPDKLRGLHQEGSLPLVLVTSGAELERRERRRGQRCVQSQGKKRKGENVEVRVGTLHVGTITGKEGELADERQG